MYQLVCCTCSKVSPVKCAENNNYSETRPAPSRIKRTTSRAEGLIRFQITPDYSWWCCCCCGRVFLDLVVWLDLVDQKRLLTRKTPQHVWSETFIAQWHFLQKNAPARTLSWQGKITTAHVDICTVYQKKTRVPVSPVSVTPAASK